MGEEFYGNSIAIPSDKLEQLIKRRSDRLRKLLSADVVELPSLADMGVSTDEYVSEANDDPAEAVMLMRADLKEIAAIRTFDDLCLNSGAVHAMRIRGKEICVVYCGEMSWDSPESGCYRVISLLYKLGYNLDFDKEIRHATR